MALRDVVIEALESSIGALSAAYSELDHCIFADERSDDEDDDPAQPNESCSCAFCEVFFARREAEQALEAVKSS